MLVVVLLWCGAMAFGQDVDNGALLAGLGGCESCHVTPEGQAYGGGYGIKTSFGTYYGSNISPDRETGIGDWTVDDFIVAMRRGRSPDSGRPYVPAFPYASFTGLSDSDLRDLYAYLMTQEPVSRVSDDHESLAVQKSTRDRLVAWSWLSSGPIRSEYGTFSILESRGLFDGCGRALWGMPHTTYSYRGRPGPLLSRWWVDAPRERAKYNAA